MTTLYVSGPITGYPDMNRAAFKEASEALFARGYDVINPHEICTDMSTHACRRPCTPSEMMLPWADYLRADLVTMLREATALAMLDGWPDSRGAVLEFQVAHSLGWEVRHWTDWL